MKNRLFVSLQAFLVCSALLLTGCENGNLFGKLTNRGDGSDPQTLIAEGNDLLRDGNYAGALALFNKALANDPDNAQALYGSAIAQMGTTGISFGTLVSNITGATSLNNAGHDLASVLRQGRVSVSGVPHDHIGSILNGIDLAAVAPVMDEVVCKLQKIVSGNTDGSIHPDNVDVLINMSLLAVVRVVVTAVNLNYFDIVNNGTAYEIDLIDDFDEADCGGELALQVARDTVTAWRLLNKAADVLGFSGDQVIVELRQNMEEAIADMQLELQDGDYDDCLADLTAVGIPNAFKTDTNSVFIPGHTDYCN